MKLEQYLNKAEWTSTKNFPKIWKLEEILELEEMSEEKKFLHKIE